MGLFISLHMVVIRLFWGGDCCQEPGIRADGEPWWIKACSKLQQWSQVRLGAMSNCWATIGPVKTFLQWISETTVIKAPCRLHRRANLVGINTDDSVLLLHPATSDSEVEGRRLDIWKNRGIMVPFLFVQSLSCVALCPFFISLSITGAAWICEYYITHYRRNSPAVLSGVSCGMRGVNEVIQETVT